MNYTEITNAALAYADREDIEVSNNLDVFIVMAESRINRVLKTREQSNRVYTPVGEDQFYYSLPPDYLGMRDIQINSDVPYVDHSTTSFEYINPQQFNNLKAGNDKLFYTIIADQIQIFPAQATGTTLEIVYYRRVPPLTESATTNWLSNDHPDIYLSGIISQIEAFVKNYEVSKNWDDRMTRCISELEKSDITERWSGTPLQMRVG